MTENQLSLEEQFGEARSVFESFSGNVAGLLQTLCLAEGIEFLQIESRTKTAESFKDKIGRPEKKGKYKSIGDITDISGIRIISYYQKDVDRICRIIEENFDVDKENSTDKKRVMDADRFGYLSVHYVVKHSKLRSGLPENRPFSGMVAEIQVRTVLQHAWAVLDRRLRYNSKNEVPEAVKRKLFLVSAKLEDADENLSEIDSRVSLLRAQYAEEISRKELVTEINRDSLEVFIQNSPSVAKIWVAAEKADIASRMKVNSDDGERSIGYAIKLFKALEVKSIQNLDRLISDSAVDIDRKLGVFSEEIKKNNIRMKYTKYGLIRLVLCLSADQKIARLVEKNSSFRAETIAAIHRTIQRIR
ncbi:GTP pyrophosphokinase [Aminobacter sp. LjRoot7]|uniref:GTP pyrophosphokinase n=1 Tax=Aminobacter sp. LjRoot7 TaxID=3342335 RepID=UPI003ECCC5EC